MISTLYCNDPSTATQFIFEVFLWPKLHFFEHIPPDLSKLTENNDPSLSTRYDRLFALPHKQKISLPDVAPTTRP